MDIELIKKELNTLLEQKEQKQKSKEKSGYNAGWVDTLKYVLNQLEKKK